MSKSTNTWTAAGQLIAGLRTIGQSETSTDNPFLLGLEAPALLRQVLEVDGVLLRHVITALPDPGATVTRTTIAESFDAIVDATVSQLRDMRIAPIEMREALEFQRLIRDQTQKLARTRTKATGSSRAPGVLEHRVAPRLEWLTDLGYLTKDGLAKNSFEYRVSPAVTPLREAMDTWLESDYGADEIALGQWNSNPVWSRLRSRLPHFNSRDDAVRAAYRIMQRRIGPAPLREVAFTLGMIDGSATIRDCVDELVAFATDTEGVTLSRGRYRRTPENIFISPAVLERNDVA
jgi:hypothetical protein